MSKRETRLTLRPGETAEETIAERQIDRAKLSDLGLAGSGGEMPVDEIPVDDSGTPAEDDRLDDRIDNIREHALSAEVPAPPEHRFSFVSPTDDDFAELDDPVPEIKVEGYDDMESVRAFAYHEGPCGSTIVNAPAGDLPEAEGSERLTVIESPLAGNVALNTAYAKAAMRDSLERGEAPFASHLLYAQSGILDDADPIERGRGILAGLAWTRWADRCAVYTDLGISSGMGLGIASAQANGIRIEYRTLGETAVRDLLESYGQP